MLIPLLLLLGAAIPDIEGGALFLSGDQSERTNLHENATRLFRQCAQQSEVLRPYALSRAAANYHALGQDDTAEELFQYVLDTYPEGPWVRLAWKRMGDMYYQQGHVVKARSYYNKALAGLDPLPWFLDNLAWNNADYALLLPGYEQEGYAWFRHIVQTTIYIAPRRNAAERLLKSTNAEDRVWGIYGYIRCSKLREAREALDKEAVLLKGTDGNQVPLSVLDITLATAQSDLPGTQQRLSTLLQVNKSNTWARVWLMVAVREQAGNKRWPVVEMLAQLFSETFPDGRDAGDIYWSMALRYEAVPDKEGANRMYRLLADRHSDHVRAPRSLLYLANNARDAKNSDEAFKLYEELGRTFPDERLTAEGYYNAAQLAASLGKSEEERAYLKKAAGVGIGHFHAHRALDVLRTKHKIMPKGVHNLPVDGTDSFLLPMPMTLAGHEKYDFMIKDTPVLQRLQYFGIHGLEEGEWEALNCILTAPESLQKLWFPAIAEAGFMHTMNQYMYARNWGVENGLPTEARRRIEYPLAYREHVYTIAKELGIDLFLVLAVARQESTFRAGIKSSAGATGVLQLMPSTANWLAKVDSRITNDHVANLESPFNSIRLGAVYLERMLKRSGNNMVYALASYNAGPGNCDKWRKRFSGKSLEAFAETIPFTETNGYVKKVLANYAAYHSLYPTLEVTAKK